MLLSPKFLAAAVAGGLALLAARWFRQLQQDDKPWPSAQVSSIVITPPTPGAPPKRTSPLLFVHGNSHGGWVFTALANELAERGWTSHLIEMPKSRFKSLGGYTDDVQEYIRKHDLTAPILIGHSQGGLVVQHYLLNRQDEMPAHTHAKAAVFLASLSAHSVKDNLKFVMRCMIDNPAGMGRYLIDFNAAHVIGHTFEDLDHAKKAMFAPGTTRTKLAGREETLEAYLARLSPVESGSTLLDLTMHLLFHGGNKASPEELGIATLTVSAEHDGIVPAFVTEGTAAYWQQSRSLADSMLVRGQGHCFGDGGWEKTIAVPLAGWLDKAAGK